MASNMRKKKPNKLNTTQTAAIYLPNNQTNLDMIYDDTAITAFTSNGELHKHKNCVLIVLFVKQNKTKVAHASMCFTLT